MIITTPAKRNIKMNTTVYSRFKGVDFSVDASLVSKDRSPYAPNLIADVGGMPEKRLGWRTLHTLEQPIDGIWYGEINGQKSFFFPVNFLFFVFVDFLIFDLIFHC